MYVLDTEKTVRAARCAGESREYSDFLGIPAI
jgi:hypothetical protein